MEAWGGEGISYERGGAVMVPEEVGDILWAGKVGYVIEPAEADPLSGTGTMGEAFWQAEVRTTNRSRRREDLQYRIYYEK
jgi:hypothetical protein